MAPLTIRTVLICGAGAVGSTYAESLQGVEGASVWFVARGERRARLERDGVRVNGRTFRVRCVEPGELATPPDLILVAVKQHHLAAAIEQLRGFVDPRTILVSLMNGITSEGELAEAFGAEQVLHAFTLGNDVVRQGSETRYSSMGRLVIGARSNDPADARVLAVKQLVEKAGIPVTVPDDILREQWWKFVLNTGVNQVSAVLRAPYGAFRDVPEVHDLARRAALEAAVVARCEGIALGPEDVDRIFPILERLAPHGKTSMLQDVEAGRKTEVELFADTVVRLGARHGVPTPVNELLGVQIRALERLAGVRGD